VSDEIVVLYLGGVAEYGDMRQVIENPPHPYTRLLVGSAPVRGRGEAERDERARAYIERPPPTLSI
jgi:ABC-type dipeptide/oligopeptide/nickel transport system ATPase component